MSPFSESLEILRRSRGLTQAKLADMAGVTSNYVSLLERGKKGPPSDSVLRRIIRALKLNEEERAQLTYDAELAQFSLKMPSTASRDEYEMVCKLQEHLGSLTAKQVQLIELAMSVTGGIKNSRRRLRMGT